MSYIVNSLGNCCTRYGQPEDFECPDDIFVATGPQFSKEEINEEMWVVETVSTKKITEGNHTQFLREIRMLSKGRYILEECGRSISDYALTVLINLHNKVMSSEESYKLTKIVCVILLGLAALVVCAFAIVEAIIRIVLSILLIPSLCCGNTLEKLLHFSGRTSLTIPNALVAPIQFTTSQGTVQPWL